MNDDAPKKVNFDCEIQYRYGREEPVWKTARQRPRDGEGWLLIVRPKNFFKASEMLQTINESYTFMDPRPASERISLKTDPFGWIYSHQPLSDLGEPTVLIKHISGWTHRENIEPYPLVRARWFFSVPKPEPVLETLPLPKVRVNPAPPPPHMDPIVRDPPTPASSAPIVRRVPQALRKMVWETHTEPGSSESGCYVCSKVISVWDFEAGHIVAAACGGEMILSNLRPVCALCNKSCGKQHLEDFKKQFR